MMRRVAGGVISLGLIATSTAAFAQSHSIQSALMIVFAGSGCAIGPATRAAAIQYGFPADVVASFEADMRNRDIGAKYERLVSFANLSDRSRCRLVRRRFTDRAWCAAPAVVPL